MGGILLHTRHPSSPRLPTLLLQLITKNKIFQCLVLTSLRQHNMQSSCYTRQMLRLHSPSICCHPRTEAPERVKFASAKTLQAHLDCFIANVLTKEVVQVFVKHQYF